MPIVCFIWSDHSGKHLCQSKGTETSRKSPTKWRASKAQFGLLHSLINNNYIRLESIMGSLWQPLIYKIKGKV